MPNENGTSIHKLRRNTTITGHFNATQCLCEPVNIRRSRTRREQALPSFSKSGLKVATAQQGVTLWNCGQLPNLSTTPCHAIGKQLELGSPKRQAWCSLRLFVEVCCLSQSLSSCLRPHHWNSANDHWGQILDIDGRWWKGIVEFSRSYESAVWKNRLKMSNTSQFLVRHSDFYYQSAGFTKHSYPLQLEIQVIIWYD